MISLSKLISKTYRMARPHESRAVVHNAAYLTILQVITYVSPLIVIPYLFRTIGADKFGLLAFAQAFIQYCIMLTDYGFAMSATKEISLVRNDSKKVSRIFSSVIACRLLLTLLSLIILSILVISIPRFRHDWLVYVVSTGMILGNALFPLWFFQGMEKMYHIANINSAGGILFPYCIFVFVHSPNDYLLVPLFNSLIFLITGGLGIYVALTRFKLRLIVPRLSDIKQQFISGWHVFTSLAAINAYTTTRIFLMGLLTNNVITGYYSIAERIASVCQTFPLSSFTQALFPRLSAIYHKNKTKAFTIMHHLERITLISVVLSLPLVWISAPFIIEVACGEVHQEAVIALRMLLIGVFCVSVNAFPIQFLLVCGKSAIYSRIHVIMGIIGLPTLFLCIASLSYMGAALATIIIEISIVTITHIVLYRKSKGIT